MTNSERPPRILAVLGIVAVSLAILLPLAFVIASGTQQNGVMIIAIGVLAILPLSWGLVRLRTCLNELAQGRPFTSIAIAGLRDFAIGSALAAIARPIASAVLSLAISWSAPAGQKHIAIDVSSDTLLLAFFSATIAALAWAMQRAAKLDEENRGFV
jgi:hypothetical protein